VETTEVIGMVKNGFYMGQNKLLLSKMMQFITHLNIYNGTPSGVPSDVPMATLLINQLKSTDITPTEKKNGT
jgi:hypothetical protein